MTYALRNQPELGVINFSKVIFKKIKINNQKSSLRLKATTYKRAIYKNATQILMENNLNSRAEGSLIASLRLDHCTYYWNKDFEMATNSMNRKSPL
ncbi:hypothetical protein [Pseudovibrio ascidiaceicola]|uniref:hypothetical protein n=1 Tax=Pseudovibrio ascidiaceicola TaxID=285279 RepID=UPI001AD8FD45|nr:hypothetical protein [Pseudovibrio ascidiaceicola]